MSTEEEHLWQRDAEAVISPWISQEIDLCLVFRLELQVKEVTLPSEMCISKDIHLKVLKKSQAHALGLLGVCTKYNN